MVSPGFSPKAVRSMEDDIRNKVKELLENVSDLGSLILLQKLLNNYHFGFFVK